MENYKKINFFILFDLIGSSKQTFADLMLKTMNYFENLMDIEIRLNQQNLLQSTHGYFKKNSFHPSDIIYPDDHFPFHIKHVPTLHIIPPSFPTVWHKESDNINNIDYKTVFDMIDIFKVFIVEYFNIDPSKK